MNPHTLLTIFVWLATLGVVGSAMAVIGFIVTARDIRSQTRFDRDRDSE